MNSRLRTITVISSASIFLLVIIGTGFFLHTDNSGINLEMKNEAPSLAHLFGTDWLGRDMLLRTIKGLSLSFSVGVIAALSSTLIALMLSLLSYWNNITDSIVTWLTDLFLSVPHMITLLLISFAFGGGFKGVIIGLALTHWPSLTRLLRAEVLQIKQAEYVSVSRQLGKSRVWAARHHILPHLLPQLMIGFILMFPHAILHEAAITFLGFGLSTETPAIGNILSEAMRYLSMGYWWLAFFPGLALLAVVGVFDLLGRSVRKLINPIH
ncbi:peptide ABC transporter permease [Sporosarcina sp. P37]|nr:peptide ABC transporter permease [Sporosarcina sp. P33]ARK26232.1 peptide ABC transporter permease [Sporosarcina sp. P37]PID20071.1 ABC transporter permease [Sporosarcina sp. P35]